MDEANRRVSVYRNKFGEELDLTTEENNVYGLVIELNTDTPEEGARMLRKVQDLLDEAGYSLRRKR